MRRVMLDKRCTKRREKFEEILFEQEFDLIEQMRWEFETRKKASLKVAVSIQRIEEVKRGTD